MIEHLRGLSADDLALRSSLSHDHWPIWAIAAHAAMCRVYWLCDIFGEPGAETTPFTSGDGYGWEDEPDVVRSSDELVHAGDQRGAWCRAASNAGPRRR